MRQPETVRRVVRPAAEDRRVDGNTCGKCLSRRSRAF